MFDRGISKAGDLLDLGVEQGMLRKSGANYSYGETKLGQGREHAKHFLDEHLDVMERLEQDIRQAHAAAHEPVAIPEAFKTSDESAPAATKEQEPVATAVE